MKLAEWHKQDNCGKMWFWAGVTLAQGSITFSVVKGQNNAISGLDFFSTIRLILFGLVASKYAMFRKDDRLICCLE
jgi:hypothetical protein